LRGDRFFPERRLWERGASAPLLTGRLDGPPGESAANHRILKHRFTGFVILEGESSLALESGVEPPHSPK
jgi:hypothetical protein